MAEGPRLDAVLLDAGGTLVRLDFEWMSEAVRDLGFVLDHAALRRAEIEGRRRYDRSRGTARPPPGPSPPLGSRGDTQAYFGGMLEGAGVPPAIVEAALARWRERDRVTGLWSRPMEGARVALKGLATLGLSCAVISNSDGRAERLLHDCGVAYGISFVVDSHVVGVEKPDPAIFRIALDRLGVAPERALFVGDIRSVDEAGAGAAGTRFVLLDPYGDYASPGVPAIQGMEQLPSWVVSRYEVPEASRLEDGRP